MGRPIIKLERDGQAWLMEWSTVSDAPASWGMSEAEFRDHYREQYGSAGSADLDNRLARVNAKGTSSFDDKDAADTVAGNRAGYDECTLTIDEIIEWYCVRGELPPEGVGHVCHPADLPDGILHTCEVCGSTLAT